MHTQSLQTFLDSVAAKTPTPGGGAVAGVVGAIAAALAQMVVAYSVGKKSLAAHEPLLASAMTQLQNARFMLITLATEDSEAYNQLNALQQLPPEDPGRTKIPEASLAAAHVPLNVCALCVDLLRLYHALSTTTSRLLRSDLAVAAVLTEATLRASRYNTLINLDPLTPDDRHAILKQLADLSEAGKSLANQVETACHP